MKVLEDVYNGCGIKKTDLTLKFDIAVNSLSTLIEKNGKQF